MNGSGRPERKITERKECLRKKGEEREAWENQMQKKWKCCSREEYVERRGIRGFEGRLRGGEEEESGRRQGFTL